MISFRLDAQKTINSLRKFCIKYRKISSQTIGPEDILLDCHDNKGVITLNRPKQMNAYHMPMVKQMRAQLKTWDTDDQIRMVIIKGSGDRAFCSGGDIKIMAQKGSPYNLESCGHEYALNNEIACFSKPYVSLIDGICMGGGNGLAVHGRFRVVTEKAIFSMPECSIGFFPDVGATYFLPRLSEKIGIFLGLTGHRLSGIDLYKVGLATHFIPSERIKDLERDLLLLKDPDFKKVDDFLTSYQEQWELDFKNKDFSLDLHVGRISAAFEKADSVEQIIENLLKDGSTWAKEQLKILNKMSPTSLKVALKSQKLGSNMSLPDCLRMEYRMAFSMLSKHDDFYEGVRALFIDKNNSPKWNPDKLEDVTEEQVESIFNSTSNFQELRL
ncbi:3-hydroxyisobutyryl-CoA hydrolase, mitochondrial-like [Brevipalpus obovatus]|uniref:3-hydroxyisobutyryl-CoA hydrolase, mitochondrial-like n=1 Tax=Brevipalpus obovatus TaxID=246614 RepID=UPI003D9F5A53